MLRLAGIIILWAALCFVESTARAQTVESSPPPGGAGASGILIERISPKEYQRWEAIKRIVFAEDARGRPLHPTLQSLWGQLDQSGHTVYIELCSTGNAISSLAGAFRIEQLDPLGSRHVAVIRLYPAVIDIACVGPAAARANGFIPFKGLTREERYAEVLGHELAHAVDILNDLTRARRVVEVIEQTNEQFLAQGRQYGYANLKPEMLERIIKRDQLLKELEEPVEAIEMVIWSEIVSNHDPKVRKWVTALSKTQELNRK